jgi:hypothetical protein
LVSKIEEVYKECNKGSGSYFSDINKWSPADIYLVSNDFDTSEFDNISTLEVLNAKMKELFNSNKLIGISLKKITSNTAHYSVKNLDSNTRTKKTGDVEYRGYSSTFDSIDLYVKWGIGANDRIQFRNTGGDKLQWQGEIKGTSAAQGKVGGGVVDSILNNLGHSTLDLKTGHDELKRKTSPDYFDAAKISKEIFDFCVRFNITGFNNQPQFLDKIGMQSHSWRYSKYINLKLLDIIEGMTSEQKTEFVQSLYFYAASQSKLSAVYAKVE